MFHNGVLQRRLPYFDKDKLPDQKVVVKTRFTRDSLESFFLLNLREKDALKKLKTIQAMKKEGGAGAPG